MSNSMSHGLGRYSSNHGQSNALWRRIAEHRLLLSAGAVAIAISSATGAWAQTADDSAKVETSAGQTGEEIIVTATRRPERLHDVPLSVSVFSADQLSNAQAKDSRDLALLTPGLRIEASNNFTAPAIRGVSTTLVGANADPNVATYIDGIYQPFPQSAIYVLPDVRQIEVLKGPQGTLFGRNATGGAIIISTRDPGFGSTEGAIDLSYSSYEDKLVKGFVSQPLTDTVAASVAVYGRHSEGWYRLLNYGNRRGGGVSSYLVRAKLRFKPSEGVDFTLTGLHSRQEDRTQGMNETLFGNNSNLSRPGAFVTSKPYEYAGNLLPSTTTTTTGVSLRGTIDAGPGYFTTTTTFQKIRSPVVFDNDQTNLAIANNFQFPRSKTYSQELLYTLDDMGPLHGTIGSYFYWNRAAHFVNVNPGPGGLRGYDGGNVRDVREAADAQSVFGELTYDLSPSLSLTGGLRYSREKRKASGIQLVNSVVSNTLTPQEKTFSSVTPRVSVVYKIDEDHNLYATFSKGFKSGLFNAVGLQRQPISPEKITAYEIGSKNRFGSLTLDLSAYYYDYTDLQVQSLTTVGVGFVSIVNNAASSEIYGAEANLTWRLSNEFRLNAGLSVIHARYKEYANASVIVPNNATNTPSCDFESYTPVLTGGYRSLFCDVSGKNMIRTPSASFNVSADYTKETSAGEFSASAMLYWSDTVYYSVNNFVKQDSYATLNGQLGFRPGGNKNWKFSVFGTNLTDHRYLESVLESNAGVFVRYAPPRQIGVRVHYDF